MSEETNPLVKDGGYASRKFWFALISSILVLVASKIAPIAALAEVCAALVMICSIYVAGNAIVKWRSGNLEEAKMATKEKEEEINERG